MRTNITIHTNLQIILRTLQTPEVQLFLQIVETEIVSTLLYIISLGINVIYLVHLKLLMTIQVKWQHGMIQTFNMGLGLAPLLMVFRDDVFFHKAEPK